LTIEDFRIRTPQGSIKGMFNISLGGAQVSNAADLNQLFNSVASKAYFSLPKSLFHTLILENTEQLKFATQSNPTLDQQQLQALAKQNTDTLIAGWISQGILAEKNQQYVIDIELLRGKLKLNGKEASFPIQPTQRPTNNQGEQAN
jgi:uncharacterized protein YdgA (DUF945 family)